MGDDRAVNSEIFGTNGEAITDPAGVGAVESTGNNLPSTGPDNDGNVTASSDNGANEVAPDASDMENKETTAETSPTEDPAILAIREEIRKAIELRPVTPEEFRFKVNTVKWFGGLCSLVILLIVALDFLYIGKIIESSAAHEAKVDFGPLISAGKLDARITEIAVENEALNMRNKRTVSALFMRAYTQFLSITAGTILALFGAIFVLARVDSRETRSEASFKDFKWLMNTASPGILIATLGAVLVGFVAYQSITPIEATDVPVFPVVMQASSGTPPTTTFDVNSDAFKMKRDEDLKSLRSVVEAE